MNIRQRDQLLHDLFASASRSQPVPDGPHIVDEEELLTCWSLGALSNSDRTRMMEHLSVCSHCRHELIVMIDNGSLELPTETAEIESAIGSEVISEAGSAPIPARAPGEFRPELKVAWWRTTRVAWVVAAAAMVLIAVLIWKRVRSSTAEVMLARASQLLASGNTESAFNSVEKMLVQPSNYELSKVQRDQAQDLLGRSAYALARDKLHKREFDQVRDVVERANHLNANSARLKNIHLQAAMDVPDEISLHVAGSLTDLGYAVDGARNREAPDLTQAREAQLRETAFHAAIAEYPKDADLRVNYGKFLLDQGRAKEAHEQFDAALKLDPNCTSAQLGLGLVEYRENRFEEARRLFESYLHFYPDDLAANVNLAMTLDRLGQHEEARRLWQKSVKLTTSDELREQIQRRLAATQKE